MTTTCNEKVKALVSKAINEKINMADPEVATQKVVDALQNIGEHIVDQIVTDALNAINAEMTKSKPMEDYDKGYESGLNQAHGAVFRRFYFGV